MHPSSMHPLHIVYLNGPDIERLALGNAEILDAVEAGLRAQGAGQTVNEPGVQLIPGSMDSSAGRFDILRGVVHPLGIAGVKVAGDFIANPEFGLPASVGMLNLFDPATGVPLAILNATALTGMRAGAMTALGAKHLAKRRPRILGHLGARGMSYWNIRLLAHLFEFEEIRVHSHRPDSRESLAAALSLELGRPVQAVDSWEVCVRGADIVVETARSAEPEPRSLTRWIQRGVLVIAQGATSPRESSLTGVVDKVVVDDRRQCPGGKSAADVPYLELGEIVTGVQPGRDDDSQSILFWHRGSPLGDIALGSAILDKAGALGVGHTLRFE